MTIFDIIFLVDIEFFKQATLISVIRRSGLATSDHYFLKTNSKSKKIPVWGVLRLTVGIIKTISQERSYREWIERRRVKGQFKKFAAQNAASIEPLSPSGKAPRG